MIRINIQQPILMKNSNDLQMTDYLKFISDYKMCSIFIYEYGSVGHTANSHYFKIKEPQNIT